MNCNYQLHIPIKSVSKFLWLIIVTALKTHFSKQIYGKGPQVNNETDNSKNQYYKIVASTRGSVGKMRWNEDHI